MTSHHITLHTNMYSHMYTRTHWLIFEKSRHCSARLGCTDLRWSQIKISVRLQCLFQAKSREFLQLHRLHPKDLPRHKQCCLRSRRPKCKSKAEKVIKFKKRVRQKYLNLNVHSLEMFMTFCIFLQIHSGFFIKKQPFDRTVDSSMRSPHAPQLQSCFFRVVAIGL